MTSRGAEKMNNDTIGVDVSKGPSRRPPAGRLARTRRFANDKGGHKALIKWLAGDAFIYRVVFEPTGALSSRNRRTRAGHRWGGSVRQGQSASVARRFARGDRQAGEDRSPGCGDPGSHGRCMLELEARPARSELLLELKELYVAREALVKDRTAAKNRGKALTLSLLKRQNAQRLEQIDRQIATVEAAILQIARSLDASLAGSLRHPDPAFPAYPTSPPFALLIAMPELGSPKPARPPTSQAWRRSPDSQGVGPVAHLFAASADVRQALYMPAPVAACFNPDSKAKYAHLIETGKTRKGRPNRNHAKPSRPCKCPPQGH